MVDYESRTARYHWMLVAILLLAFALRLFRLGAESLWYDETVSVHLASKSVPDLIAHTAGDIHPPGYYLLLHGWTRLAGASDYSSAFFSLFFGMLLVALAGGLGRRVFGARTGLLAALLVAISPFNVWYSQEVRMYTLGAVLGLGVLVALVELLPGWTQPDSRQRRDWLFLAVYALCAALGLWMLYYFAFLLAAINLMVGVWWLVNRQNRGIGWRWLGRWALAQGVVLLLYAAWLPIAWRQATQPPVPPWRSFTGLGDLLGQTWSALSLGQPVELGQVWPVLLLFLVLFGVGLLTKPARFKSWLFAGYVFIPVLLIYLASFVTPLFHVRYVFTYSTPFYIILGVGLAWLWQRWKPALWLCLTLILVFSGISIYNYHIDQHHAADDHRGAAQFLAERWRPGDAILVNAGYTYTALLTYWDGDPIAWRGRLVGDFAQFVHEGPAIVQTGTVDGEPSLGWGDPDSDFYTMSHQETAMALEQLFDSAHRVWVYRIYDTVTDPDGFVRDWLDEHGTQFEDQVFTGESQLRVQGYLTGRDPLIDAGATLNARLSDGSLSLVASSPLPAQVEVGGSLDLALTWQVGGAVDGEVILFAGLFDETGRRWAQTDERPLGSLYPVAAWPEGTGTRTPLRVPIPVGTPPGSYQLQVGWYRFVDGQPIWLPWPEGALLNLGDVEIVAPADWQAQPLPDLACPANVSIGDGIKCLGFSAPVLEGQAGNTLHLDLFWQALVDAPGAGPAVLQLTDDSGNLFAEEASAPASGLAPFTALLAGQTIRDPRAFHLGDELSPGVYTLSLGRRQADGQWLPVRRGLFPLGSTYPLATIRVVSPTD